jgi:hypothetical protein
MADQFKPTVGAKVSKSEAQKWIKRYDDEIRKDKLKDTKSVFYGKDVLQEILKTPGAAGISFFLCLKHSSHAGKEVENLVLVPTKEDGTLLWKEPDGKDSSGSFTWDDGSVCPPLCPKDQD